MKIHPALLSKNLKPANSGSLERCWINVVIPNYNGSELIKKNLSSVIDSLEKYPDCKITIVDDGSNNEDYQKLKAYISSLNNSKVNLVREEKNQGFSSAVNRGVFAVSSDLSVILNSDVAPEKNFLESVIEDFQKNPNLFGVGCLDKSEEGEKIIERGRGIGFWKRGFIVHKKGEVGKEDTFWISGGSSIVRTEIFKKFGGFDEIYNPFYWEDIDLSYRAQKAGYDLRFENKSIVIHRHFEGAIVKHYSMFEISKISYRNQFIFVWKNITDLRLIFSHLLWLPYHFFKALLRFDLPFFQGFFLALLSLADIMNRRRQQKIKYIKKDSELLSR